MTHLSIKNVGKSFRTYSSEWKRFSRWFGLKPNPTEEKWVLRHITFDITPGEAVGIIGQNGAGKSTLLKIITGTMQPTEGRIASNGRVAAMLELGIGFNPELTGRQNVFNSASLMGFSAAQIQNVISDIEEFAEIGSYFDQPVRKYSSGMQVRVAFAAVTAFRPEILIIDEALSVGDAYFQHKSFKRIREFQDEGTTLLIVSHDRNAIQSLCNRAILLENGTTVKDGTPEEVFDYYNAIIAEKENSKIEVKQISDGKMQTSSGSGEARVLEIGLFNSNDEVTDHVAVGEDVEIRIKVRVNADIETLVLGYGIKDRLGQVMFGTNTWHTQQTISKAKAGETYSFRIAFSANLGVGSYSVQTALVDRDTHLTANYEWCDLALMFNVVNIDKTTFEGSLWSDTVISVEKILP
jgi:homopolymeric O-antigen transport system ATP-binding protein